MAAIARTVADSGGNSARTADHTVDRSAADCARGCGHRVGGFRHSATSSLENVHLFTPMGTGNKTMLYLRSTAVNRSWLTA
jgi:hypothetical protein